jgi:hypothetical protein
MVNFSEVALYLAQSPLIQHSLKVLGEVESELLFSIACEKDKIYREKKGLIKALKMVVIANATNFGNIGDHNNYGLVKILSAESIKNSENDDSLLLNLNNSLVITTSNIFADIGIERLGALYYQLPNTIFAIHDYDNHHWINNNIQAAIFSDIYIPSHQADNLISSRVNPNIVGGIPCGTNQWSMAFIKRNLSSLLACQRAEQPLGKYYFYEKFGHRNKAISTLSQSFPSINLLEKDFHALSQEQKWLEWCGHKVHWIIPVLNDLPIRFFDALITGGIPLVPSGILPFVNALDIPESFYISYGPLDIIQPKEFIKKANERFDLEGVNGIKTRSEYAVKHFHVDAIIEKIMGATLKLYEIM